MSKCRVAISLVKSESDPNPEQVKPSYKELLHVFYKGKLQRWRTGGGHMAPVTAEIIKHTKKP